MEPVNKQFHKNNRRDKQDIKYNYSSNKLCPGHIHRNIKHHLLRKPEHPNKPKYNNKSKCHNIQFTKKQRARRDYRTISHNKLNRKHSIAKCKRHIHRINPPGKLDNIKIRITERKFSRCRKHNRKLPQKHHRRNYNPRVPGPWNIYRIHKHNIRQRTNTTDNSQLDSKYKFLVVFGANRQ